MRLFRTSLFSVIRIDLNHIYALVAWKEDCINGIPDLDDSQMVLWDRASTLEIDDALAIGEFAYDSGWITSDKLTVNEYAIQSAMGWNAERTKAAIDKLLAIRVKMIDDGEEGDTFFFHL